MKNDKLTGYILKNGMKIVSRDNETFGHPVLSSYLREESKVAKISALWNFTNSSNIRSTFLWENLFKYIYNIINVNLFFIISKLLAFFKFLALMLLRKQFPANWPVL